jgi:hypothetical protein
MLPRELPISDEAVMAAHEAYHARLATQKVDETYVAMPAAIQAFLQAEGFEVQRAHRYPSGAHSGGPNVPLTDVPVDARLVSPWKPAPSSTEGGEG